MRYAFALVCLLATSQAMAAETSCSKLPGFTELQTALKDAKGQNNGGLGNDMWGAVIGRDGLICAVAYTGNSVDAQWPASRVIAAQKANTANGFSLKTMAFSTANLFSATQPGGFLFGLQESNPVDTTVAYAGPTDQFGSANDPMVGKAIGGINVFGGGLALYDSKGTLLGAIGVSGDTSCGDHNIAWRTRHDLKLDYVPMGVAPDKSDAIIYDLTLGKSASGYGHPTCGGKERDIAKQLPPVAKMTP